MRLPKTEPDTAVRAVFSPVTGHDLRAVDGAWWPRSRDLVAELPALAAELSRRDFTVTRVAYHRDSWDGAIRKLPVAGRIIRFGWFRTIDAHVVSLTGADTQGRLDLLVVPAHSDPQLAGRVFARIEVDQNHHSASTILADAEANLQTPALSEPVAARADRVAESDWESEGGPMRQPAATAGRPA